MIIYFVEPINQRAIYMKGSCFFDGTLVGRPFERLEWIGKAFLLVEIGLK